MLRQVMIPSKENSTFFIPAEFYGTEVEVLVFPSSSAKKNQTKNTIKDIFASHLYSFNNYKFDRDEANCDILYSEDMQNGQIIENTLKIVNPFV